MFMMQQAVAEAINQERLAAMARAESRHRARSRADRRAASTRRRRRLVVQWPPAYPRVLTRVRPEI
jgi:hypothetical protein